MLLQLSPSAMMDSVAQVELASDGFGEGGERVRFRVRSRANRGSAEHLIPSSHASMTGLARKHHGPSGADEDESLTNRVLIDGGYLGKLVN